MAACSGGGAAGWDLLRLRVLSELNTNFYGHMIREKSVQRTVWLTVQTVHYLTAERQQAAGSTGPQPLRMVINWENLHWVSMMIPKFIYILQFFIREKTIQIEYPVSSPWDITQTLRFWVIDVSNSILPVVKFNALIWLFYFLTEMYLDLHLMF